MRRSSDGFKWLFAAIACAKARMRASCCVQQLARLAMRMANAWWLASLAGIDVAAIQRTFACMDTCCFRSTAYSLTSDRFVCYYPANSRTGGARISQRPCRSQRPRSLLGGGAHCIELAPGIKACSEAQMLCTAQQTTHKCKCTNDSVNSSWRCVVRHLQLIMAAQVIVITAAAAAAAAALIQLGHQRLRGVLQLHNRYRHAGRHSDSS